MINLKKPRFITFEGGEGSGKSTQSKMLYEYLLSKEVKVILTREVGGTPEAEKIRDILLHSELSPLSELLLVMAARYEHINKVIISALSKKTWVICDRFIDSTACYQGQHPDITIRKIYQLHEEMMPLSLMPDLTFFIDISPEIALQRIINRDGNNKFEDKEISFHQRVYQQFQTISDNFQERIFKIEAANLSKEEVHKKVVIALNFLFDL